MMRTVSLSFEKRASARGQDISVRLMVLDEATSDVVTVLVLTPEEFTALCSSQVLRIEERG